MSENRRGTWIGVSPGRAMVLEVLHHAKKVPSLPLKRTCDVRRLQELRRETTKPISWFALFFRAYGIVSQRRPILRRSYVRFPWTHYYQHPYSIGSFLVEREIDGENVVLGARIQKPEEKSLAELNDRIREFQESPIEEIKFFRDWLRVGRLPWMVRRGLFHLGLTFSGHLRAKQFGTFVMSSLGNQGVEQGHPLSSLTSYISFGPISEQGKVVTTLVYDHRVLDGREVGRTLIDLEEVLNNEVLQELKDLCRTAKAA